MNKLLLYIPLIVFLSCKSKPSESAYVENSTLKNYNAASFTKNNKKSYAITFNIQQIDSKSYHLITNIQLEQGAHFVSPNSKRDFKGKLKINLPENNTIIIDKTLIESPKSTEEYDAHPFIAGFVNWVKVTTRYEQKITLNSKQDFELSGEVEFVIEPDCTLEKVPFTITQQNGNLAVFNNGC